MTACENEREKIIQKRNTFVESWKGNRFQHIKREEKTKINTG